MRAAIVSFVKAIGLERVTLAGDSIGGVLALLHMRAAQSKRAGAHLQEPIPVATLTLREADGVPVDPDFLSRAR